MLKRQRARKERLLAEQQAWMQNPGHDGRGTLPGTLSCDLEEMAIAWRPVREALEQDVARLAGPLLCAVGIHKFSIAHPYYCGRCGRHYGLRK